MAIGLSEAGANIVGVDLHDLDETRKTVESNGKQFLGIEANLSDTRVIKDIIDGTIREFGRIDVLINNAGIIRRADAIEFSEKDWDDVISVNLKTVFFLSQAVAKQYIKQGMGGKIISVASMLSFQGGIRVPSYTASKSGVMGITRLMANEWAKHNINVNAIAPGYMATDNTTQLREDPERSKEILARIPAGRWGMPEDLKGVAVFLASEASQYVNGYTIAVDGGWLAR
jgi:2-deoxy-D-gluconate 3-dehydrogenase